MNKIINSHHIHIDNGGITFTIVEKNDDSGLAIQIKTEYLGYPAIVCELLLGQYHVNIIDYFESLGKMFIETSKILKYKKEVKETFK